MKKNQMTTEEIKDSIFYVFKDIIGYCEEHNLKYSLAFGTLLGAIREKGFIPWDIDMDIFMPRPDYDYFLKNYKPKTSNITIFDHDKYSNYHFNWAKIVDNRTICDEHYKGYKNNPYGCYVDICPLDGIDDKNEKRIMKKSHILRYTVGASLIKPSKLFPLHYNIGIVILNILAGWWPRQGKIAKVDKLCREIPYDTAEKVTCIAPGDKYYYIFDKSIVEDTVWGEFEGVQCRIPRDYEAFLTNKYGDYMTPPPLNKRKDFHTFNYYYWK